MRLGAEAFLPARSGPQFTKVAITRCQNGEQFLMVLEAGGEDEVLAAPGTTRVGLCSQDGAQCFILQRGALEPLMTRQKGQGAEDCLEPLKRATILPEGGWYSGIIISVTLYVCVCGGVA